MPVCKPLYILCMLRFNNILKGMNGNLGDLTKGNSDMFHALLGVKVCPLTFTEFKCLYKINFSEHASNED